MSIDVLEITDRVLTKLQSTLTELATELGALRIENATLKERVDKETRSKSSQPMPIKTFKPGTQLVPKDCNHIGNAVITKFDGYSCIIVTDFGNEIKLPVTDLSDLYMQSAQQAKDLTLREELANITNDTSFVSTPETQLLERFKKQKTLIDRQISKLVKD